jgi:hypothetical protein
MNSDIFKNNLVVYTTKCHQQEATDFLKKDKSEFIYVKYVHDQILIGQDTKVDFQQNKQDYIDFANTELNGKDLLEIQEYLNTDEARQITNTFVADLIIIVTGVITYDINEFIGAGLNFKVYPDIKFLGYIDFWFEETIKASYIPYNTRLFKATDKNITLYLGAILDAYLSINPKDAFDDVTEYSQEDLIKVIKKANKTFCNFFEFVENKDKAIIYINAFINSLTLNDEDFHAHIHPYQQGQN